MENINFVFEQYDDDKDGFLKPTEFFSFLYELGHQEVYQDQFMDCFRSINTSGSGMLSLPEFRVGLNMLSDIQFLPHVTKSKPKIAPENSPHYSLYLRLREADERDFEIAFEESEGEEEDDDDEEDDPVRSPSPFEKSATTALQRPAVPSNLSRPLNSISSSANSSIPSSPLSPSRADPSVAVRAPGARRTPIPNSPKTSKSDQTNTSSESLENSSPLDPRGEVVSAKRSAGKLSLKATEQSPVVTKLGPSASKFISNPGETPIKPSTSKTMSDKAATQALKPSLIPTAEAASAPSSKDASRTTTRPVEFPAPKSTSGFPEGAKLMAKVTVPIDRNRSASHAKVTLSGLSNVAQTGNSSGSTSTREGVEEESIFARFSNAAPLANIPIVTPSQAPATQSGATGLTRGASLRRTSGQPATSTAAGNPAVTSLTRNTSVRKSNTPAASSSGVTQQTPATKTRPGTTELKESDPDWIKQLKASKTTVDTAAGPNNDPTQPQWMQQLRKEKSQQQ